MRINGTATVEITVQESGTAKAISISEKNDFPAVYATAKMIALMGLASARTMRSGLNPDHAIENPHLPGGQVLRFEPIFNDVGIRSFSL